MANSNKTIGGVLFAWDIFTLVATLLISVYYFHGNNLSVLDWVLFAGFVLFWLLVGYWFKMHDWNLYNGFSVRILRFVKLYVFLIILVYVGNLLFTFPPYIRNIFIAFSIGFPIIGIMTNFVIISLVNRISIAGRTVKYSLVAGIGGAADKVRNYYQAHPSLGYRIKGFVKCKNEVCRVNEADVIGHISEIDNYLRDHEIDEIIIALPIKSVKKIKKVIEVADYHGKRVRFIPDYRNLLGDNYKITHQNDLDVINVREVPLDNRFSFFMKEIFDWAFSAVALLMLSPLFLLVGMLIKLDSPGPVFYCPVRIGRGGKPFKVFKFRTMCVNDNSTGGTMSTQHNDPRITRIGKFLRKHSIDELPQFANAFLGDMSVVGPRPHRSYLNQQFQASEKKYMVRHYFKPGITGWAQVNGWRGPTETEEQKHQRTIHDLWYVENWSMMLDLKIIYLTIFSKKAHKMAF